MAKPDSALQKPVPRSLDHPSGSPEELVSRAISSALEGLATSTPALVSWLDEIDRIKAARGEKLTAGELLCLVRTHAAIQKELRDTLTAGALITKLGEVSDPVPIHIVLPDRVADVETILEVHPGSPQGREEVN